MEYELGAAPRVYVVRPALERRGGRRPPHLYDGGHLCLYRGAHEWNGRMLVADTTLPWASEWLLFYELWLATGDWLARGEHPGRGRTRRERRRADTRDRRHARRGNGS